eukprot:scaffold16765_cov149-Skeletonema_marinoi.AAC.1
MVIAGVPDFRGIGTNVRHQGLHVVTYRVGCHGEMAEAGVNTSMEGGKVKYWYIVRTYSKIQRRMDTYTTLASREQPHRSQPVAVLSPSLLIQLREIDEGW